MYCQTLLGISLTTVSFLIKLQAKQCYVKRDSVTDNYDFLKEKEIKSNLFAAYLLATASEPEPYMVRII